MTQARGRRTSLRFINQLSLWPHQVEAVRRSRSYINAFNNGRVDNKKSSLIHMPTGSGKTGVMVALSRCLQGVGCALILAPRVALRDQIYQNVSCKFFNDIGFSGEVPKRVRKIDEGFPNIDDSDFANHVFVATIQKIHSLFNTNKDDFRKLKDNVELLIVDEGHYEPAVSWRIPLREIDTPKIIFTATPYRNDLKVFDIDEDHIFSYSFAKATEDRFLRNVQAIPHPRPRNPQAFVDDLIHFYDQTFPHNQGNQPKVIIRCETSVAINEVAQALIERGRSVVAIHERFGSSGEVWAHKKVPEPAVTDAIFWIHQYKLLEGIDDPRFQVLATYQPLSNARALVQQIGRVIRNPNRTAHATAYFLDYSNGKQIELCESGPVC